MMPTIIPELNVDDHNVEIGICQTWLRSLEGQLAKVENPQGYQNVIAHLDIHMQMQQQINSQMVPASPMGNQPPKEGPAADKRLKNVQ